MTDIVTHEERCVFRTADSDEQAFFARVAAEAGFDRASGRDPDIARSVGGQVRAVEARVAFRRGCVAGFYQLASSTCVDDVAVLDYLYVHHQARRTGVGRALFDDLRRRSAERRLGSVRIVAHPASESFFHRVGAERLGTVAATTAVPWSRPEFRLTNSIPEIQAETLSGRRSSAEHG